MAQVVGVGVSVHVVGGAFVAGVARRAWRAGVGASGLDLDRDGWRHRTIIE